MGTLSMMHSSVVSSAAAMIGSAAFFAPLTTTSPRKGICPSITSLSIALPLPSPCRSRLRVSGGRHALTPTARYLEADARPPQGRLRLDQVCPFSPLLDESQCSFLGSLRPLDIDLFSSLGGIGQDQDPVVANLTKAAADREVNLISALAHPQRAGLQGCHQRGMPGEDAEFPQCARRYD